MAVERAFAQAWKVLAASQYIGCAKAGEKLSRVSDRLLRMRRNRARTHHITRRFKRQIEHGSEVYVKSESATVSSNQFAVPAEKFTFAGGEHFSRSRSRPQNVAEAVN